MTISEEIKKIEKQIEPYLQRIQANELYNQKKVLEAFQKLAVSDSDFNPTTGYGYDDYGRDKLEAVYSSVFKAEDALVRPQISSGTHAITLALFGVLRPNDHLLYITGKPYDTLEQVIKSDDRKGGGALEDFGIEYDYVPLLDGDINMKEVEKSIQSNTKVVAIQRSKGYDSRPSLSIEKIEKAIEELRRIKKDLIIFVDNCYGEFVETKEPPLEVGADIIAGSLIKNPGGGIARTGGYVAGKKELVEMAAFRLTAPGIGKEIGASLACFKKCIKDYS